LKEAVMGQKGFARVTLSLALLAAATVPAGAGDSLWGKVTAVKGPILVTLDYGSGAYDIRIVGIDAPNVGEPLYAQAQAFVEGLVLNKNARMRLHHRGANGQLVCRLFTDDPVIGIKEVGVELVRAGLARRQPGYDEKYGELAAAESEAQAAGRGLWASAPSK
jgi:endonuclease YncB( thermonuclease family)